MEQLRKAAGASHGLLLTTAPRGGLQLMQPANVSDALIKAYAREFHFEDRLSWQVVLRRKPMRPEDVWSAKELGATVYAEEWLKRHEITHVVAVPLANPVLDGYPGVVHLGRTVDQGPFSASEVSKLVDLADTLAEKLAAQRSGRRNYCGPRSPETHRPPVRFVIIDGQLKPKMPTGAAWEDVDDRLRTQMTDTARRRMQNLNGDSSLADRILMTDAHGDSWPFRIVAFKRYPALGDGSFTMFCMQPGCCEWGAVRPADFQADAELARLLPALRFMQQEFHNGPTLVDIAKQVELSPFHFHRRFTELLGLTPKQFLLDCQIFQAKSDLLARKKELVQIAKECGFAHQSHFTSRFKQATGLTPTRWRRMATARAESDASEN